MSATPDEAPKGGLASGKTMRIVLFVSLAINMFLLGAWAVTLARSLAHPDRPHLFSAREFPGPGFILRALPADERARLEHDVGPKRQMMREAVQVSRRARRAAFQAFTAKDYSAKEMDERLQTLRAADLAAVGAVHDLLADVIDGLSPEDRIAILEAVRDRGGMSPDRPFGGDAPPGPPDAPAPPNPPPSDGP